MRSTSWRRVPWKCLKEQLRNRKIDYTDITQPDQQNNPDHLVLKGMQPAARSDLLTIVQERLPEYDVTGGADNSWNLAMKPSSLADLKSKAVDAGDRDHPQPG